MESLRFETSLKEVPVTLVDANGVERQCTLKELTGAQRSIYNESFKIKIQMDGDEAKAVPGEDFKTFPAEEFLSMCLYDENGVQISKEVIGAYPPKKLSIEEKTRRSKRFWSNLVGMNK